jgi:hypothetical protein
MAEENPTWGYTRIRGALKNLRPRWAIDDRLGSSRGRASCDPQKLGPDENRQIRAGLR